MDFVLKQRLVGAVVLVALGVIFIPAHLAEKVVKRAEAIMLLTTQQPVNRLAKILTL